MIDEHNLRAASNTPASRRPLRRTGLVLALLLAVQGVPVTVDADLLVDTRQTAAREPARNTYTLGITTKDGITDISVNAEGAKLSEIAADLSKRLGARVILGPTIEKDTISVKFSDYPLEPALTSLAPHVYIDYELRQGAPPAPQGIYLLGYTDPEPAVNTVVRGMSQGLLITGHTEDTTKSPADDPLKVFGDKNRLTITSKQQPLSVVVMAIADVLGVPVDITYDAAEAVDTDIRDRPPEQAIPELSPNVRLYVRVDVSRFEKTLLRLVVARPAAK